MEVFLNITFYSTIIFQNTFFKNKIFLNSQADIISVVKGLVRNILTQFLSVSPKLLLRIGSI